MDPFMESREVLYLFCGSTIKTLNSRIREGVALISHDREWVLSSLKIGKWIAPNSRCREWSALDS